MGLRQQAAADLQAILQDADSGFGWPITVQNPAGAIASLVGFSNDVSQMIDMETGMAISGRVASVALSLDTLEAVEGLGIPVGVADTTGKPWLVTFNDVLGHEHVFKVREARPDRALGVVICLLETYARTG